MKTTLILPDDLYVKLKQSLPARRLQLQQAMQQAVELWLDASKKSSDASPENKPLISAPEKAPLSPEAKSWLNLLTRALAVRDPVMRKMLEGIKTQLRIVADNADLDPENNLPPEAKGKQVAGAKAPGAGRYGKGSPESTGPVGKRKE